MSAVDYTKTFRQRAGADVGRSKECMFPIVAGPPYGANWWCGDVSRDGSSYCDKHHVICWRPANEGLHNRFVRHTEFVGRISK